MSNNIPRGQVGCICNASTYDNEARFGRRYLVFLPQISRGITPFAVLALSDTGIDHINEQLEAIETATSSTIKDVTSAGFKVEGPTTFYKLTKMLKRFRKLLYAMFGKACPLLIEIVHLVEFLDDYRGEQ